MRNPFKKFRTIPQLLFFFFLRPLFPIAQKIVLGLRIIKGPTSIEGPLQRQPFSIGYLRDDVSIAFIKQQLKGDGYFTNRVAYIDPGQVLSMRKISKEFPDVQYHIRVFSDGEVRGHKEYTPEDHPIKHMKEDFFFSDMQEFRDVFRNLLK
jgi:hypothetical protein